jgi:hypothetical protein
MRGLSYITTHAEDAGARFTAALRGGNFEQFAETFAGRYQGLEDVAYSLIEGRQLPFATDATLDQIGAKVGQLRAPGQTDAVYRVAIYGKIAENISYGTLPDLYNILGALELTRVKIYPTYPAGLTVNFVSNSLVLTCACIGAILRRATPPVTIIDITQHSENPFGFEGDITASGFDAGELGEGV